MSIIIHQSLCGETSNKAWGLLNTTLTDREIAKKVAFKTDLQDQTGGVSWHPNIRGFLQDDFFLLIKTFPDKSPSVRPGRKFSHVLHIPKGQLKLIHDISLLFKHLLPEIDKQYSIQSINHIPVKQDDKVYSDSFSQRFNKAIHGFSNLNKYNNTILWVGQDDFEQALSFFWKILSLKEKKNLNFGINFNTDSIPLDKINFITTPENIESKFLKKGFCIIKPNDNYTLAKFSEKLLAGYTNEQELLSAFKSALEISSLEKSEIDNIAIVINTFEQYETIKELKKLNTLSHVVAEYSPDPQKGKVFKDKLVKAICTLVENGTASDVFVVKQFKTDSFDFSKKLLEKSINEWLQNNLFSSSKIKEGNITSIFSSLDPQSTNWWIKFIFKSISEFLSKITLKKVRVILNWLQASTDACKIVFDKAENSKSCETLFIKEISKELNLSVREELLGFSRKRKWYELHANLLLMELSPLEALSQQMELEEKKSLVGIELICSHISTVELIEFTLKNGDNRLINIVGKLCSETPALLENIDVTSLSWQGIWLSSIKFGNKVEYGLEEPQNTVFQILDFFLAGGHVNPELLEKISDSGYTNLLDYEQREALWDILPNDMTVNFLSNTALSYLILLSNDPSLELPKDNVLLNYLRDKAISAFLVNNRDDIKTTLPIFEKWGDDLKKELKDYLKNYSEDITSFNAIQLGKLVNTTKNSDAAKVISKKAISHNYNWRYAIAECSDLLDFLAKAALLGLDFINPISINEDEWWEALEEILIDLYSNETKLRSLWRRARGSEADLLMSTNVKSAWKDALNSLRNNNYESITLESLLEIIVTDHNHIDKVKLLNQLKIEIIK